MGILDALRRLFEWLLGTRGESVYLATYRTDSWTELGCRLDVAVRTEYGNRGFEVRTEVIANTCFINAYRGKTAGFMVGLVAETVPSGEEKVLLGVSRSSRVDQVRTSVAGIAAILAFFAFSLAMGAAGWPLPGGVFAVVALAVSFCTGVVVLRLLLPVTAIVSRLGGNRLTDDEIAAITDLVKTVAEKNEASLVAVQTDAGPGGGGP